MSTAETQLISPPQGMRPGELVPRKPEDVTARRERDREERTKQYLDLNEYLLNVSRKVESVNNETEIDRLRLILKMRKFYGGAHQQFGSVDKFTNRWKNRMKPGDVMYADPVLASFVDSNVATRMKSRPKLKFTPRALERVDKQEAARYAQELYEDAQRVLFTASVREREHKHLELSGETYGLIYFKRDVPGTEVRVPKIERRSVEPQTKVWECPACDETGKVDGPSEEDQAVTGQFEAGVMNCPRCGYGKARLVGAQPFEAEVTVGYEEVPAGDAQFLNPDPLTVKVIGAPYKIKDALAVTWDSLVVRGVLEEQYPDMEIPGSGQLPLRLQYYEDLRETRGGGGETDEATMRGGEQFELLHLKRVWLNPSVYGGYTFPKDTELPNGQVIPKGTTLKKLFPSGLCYSQVGQKVIDLYEQSIGSCWSHCQNITGDGFHGIGQWDLLPLQEMMNELVSLQFAAEMHDSLSPLLAKTRYIEGNKMPNKPGAVVPIINADDTVPLQNIVARVPPGNHTSQAKVLREQLMTSGQYRAGAFSTSGDAPDVKAAGTATGIAIMQEQSVGRMGPSLALQAELEVERAYQILELRQQNWPEEMYQTLDRKVGGDAGRWFREADVRRDFRIEVVPQSWWPQTEAQRRVDFMEYMKIVATLVPQSPDLIESLVKRAGELYGRGIEIEPYQNDRVEARIRLERIGQIADFLERESGVPVYDPMGVPLPQMIALALERSGLVPEMPGRCVNPILDRHDQYVQAFSTWLLTSEGREASAFRRATVNALIGKHFEGKSEQAQYFQSLEMEAARPQMEAQAQAMQAEQQQQMQQAEAEQQRKMQDREHEALTQATLEGSIEPEDALELREAVRAGA